MKKKLLLKIFDAAYMQRWNDKLRPIPFIEMDKQAHKLMIAFFLGKFEEQKRSINWITLIEGAIFEFLQRIVVTDIKPFIFDRIKENQQKYQELNKWIYQHIKEYIQETGEKFNQNFQNYFISNDDTIEKNILNAAHIYASKWEFDILKKFNPLVYDTFYIEERFSEKMENYYNLEGIKQIALYRDYQKFIDLCGQLRFQTRWANLHRFPKTSVLGHSFYVAVISYFFSLQNNSCPKRIYNNVFSGLFHDLPEVLTRDIISPVKQSVEGISDIIKEYEILEMERVFYPLLPDFVLSEMKSYTEEEFESIVFINNEKKKLEGFIDNQYNKDQYDPRDGLLIKAADELAAFIEAYSAVKNGSYFEEFQQAISNISRKYQKIGTLGNLDLCQLYEQFNDYSV
ncbi:MAG: HD domain-containing protein [Spirochaetes bacterium]|nr:HD domain-containing protein [Spirochaetota bacterium]